MLVYTVSILIVRNEASKLTPVKVHIFRSFECIGINFYPRVIMFTVATPCIISEVL